jgi:hypothetical protein
MTIAQEIKIEVNRIKSAIWEAIPAGVDKASIIIALAEAQKEIALLIIEDDPHGFDEARNGKN